MLGVLSGILAAAYAWDTVEVEAAGGGDGGGGGGGGGPSPPRQAQGRPAAPGEGDADLAAVLADGGGGGGDDDGVYRIYDDGTAGGDAGDAGGGGGGFGPLAYDDGDDDALTSPSSVAPRHRAAEAAARRAAGAAAGEAETSSPGRRGWGRRLLPPSGRQGGQGQGQGGSASTASTSSQKAIQQLGQAPSRFFVRMHRRHTTALAIHRHRIRRHEVMSSLLVGAADCLGLDQREAQGFLAMLEVMRAGTEVPAGGRAARGGGGSGAGGGSGSGSRRMARTSSATSVTRSGSLSSLSSWDNRAASLARRAGLMPIAGLAEEGTAPRSPTMGGGGDYYRKGTVDTEGWQGEGRQPRVGEGERRMRSTSLLVDEDDDDDDNDDDDMKGTNDNEYDDDDDDDDDAYDDEYNDEYDNWTNPTLTNPFLADLTPGAGFQCICLLLLQHLLRSRTGYDARARQVFKRLGLLLLIWEEKTLYGEARADEDDRSAAEVGNGSTTGSNDVEVYESVEVISEEGDVVGIQHSPPRTPRSVPSSDDAAEDEKPTRPSDAEFAAIAIRKFEAIERTVATKLIVLSNQQGKRRRQQPPEAEAAVNEGAGGMHQEQVEQSELGKQPKEGGQDEQSQGQHQHRPQKISPSAPNNKLVSDTRSGPRITRTQVMRGLKITSAGLAAGTIFAVTGGLAAPGIAAGIAAMTASTAVTAGAAAVVSALTSTAAVTAIFGVGGGGLAAYKVSRRTKGVTEFEFRREDNGRARVRAEAAARAARTNLRHRLTGHSDQDGVTAAAKMAAAAPESELYSTVCVSGWLRDIRDFQRPWGVCPNNPPIVDRLELLERFYAVHQPNKIHRCGRILAHWRGEERQLWKLLHQKYKVDPDGTFPFFEGPRFDADLNHVEEETLDRLLSELGYDVAEPETHLHHPYDAELAAKHKSRSRRPIVRLGQKLQQKIQHHRHDGHEAEDFGTIDNQPGGRLAPRNERQAPADARPLEPVSHLAPDAGTGHATPPVASYPASADASAPAPASAAEQQRRVAVTTDADVGLPRHLDTVWDYTSEYGGELYTVRWESALLMELCDSVTDMVVDVLGAGTKELLKQTALATLVTAIAIPYAMIRAADSIDSTWTLAVERADESGVELAKSLLESQAGHRPVSLVGYSMGARVIYSCLKELARHQERWEDQRERRREEKREEERRRKRAEGGEDADADGGWGGDDSSASASRSSAAESGRGGSRNGSRGGSGRREEEMKYAREPASIIEDVILMGTPNHVSTESWEAARRVVSGRLVNCYSTKDLILSVLFQYKRMTGVLRPVCGCSPVKLPGVENYDVTDMLNSHADYCLAVGPILRLVGHGQPRPTKGTGLETVRRRKGAFAEADLRQQQHVRGARSETASDSASSVTEQQQQQQQQ